MSGSTGKALNRIVSVLDAEDVRVEVAAESKLAVFVEAAMIFRRRGWIAAPSTVTDALEARERLASTSLGRGVAIPHCRLKGLKAPVAAVLRLREPLAFGGPDDEPVRLFFFLFVPEMATESHLEILAEMAEMLSDKGVRERLKHEGDAAFAYATIAGWTPHVGGSERNS